MKTYNCSSAPELLLVDSDYLPEENLENNLLIGYGYAKSTFQVNLIVIYARGRTMEGINRKFAERIVYFRGTDHPSRSI